MGPLGILCDNRYGMYCVSDCRKNPLYYLSAVANPVYAPLRFALHEM